MSSPAPSSPQGAPPSREEALALVARSPELVAAHDKEGWLGLFAPVARIEDPVGTLHERGPTAPGGHDWLAAFWDVFIGPNQIRFQVHEDIVVDWVVVRVVSIETTLAFGATILVPATLRYQLGRGEGGELHLVGLRAYWEITDNVRAGLRLGPRGWAALSLQSWRMLRSLGLGGTWRYLAGLWQRFTEDAGQHEVPGPGPLMSWRGWRQAGLGVARRYMIESTYSGVCFYELVPGSREVSRVEFIDEAPPEFC